VLSRRTLDRSELAQKVRRTLLAAQTLQDLREPPIAPVASKHAARGESKVARAVLLCLVEREASTMVDVKHLKATLQHELESLVRTRDELRVQAHLAKADARKELERLEAGLLQLQDEAKRMAMHSKDAAHDIGATTRALLDDLKQGFDRIKRELQAN
jgi:hypothetical protein